MTDQGVVQKVREALQAFYPLILSVVATPLILRFDVLWVGILLGVILFALKNTWWTCIFGLLNAMAVVVMMTACVVAWIASNKNEANKASLLTPDPPPVPVVMTATTSTRSRSLAPGQA